MSTLSSLISVNFYTSRNMAKLISNIKVVTIALLFVLLVQSYAAATIIGTSFSFTNSPTTNINEATGAGVFLGNTGFGGLNSLASNSAGTLFSATNLFGGGGQLVTINPTTGIGTAGPTLNFGTILPEVRGLAFRPSDDVLFAINNTGFDELFTINVGNGVGTLVGTQGVTGLQGIDFAPNGTLFGWDIFTGLVTINTTTGAVTDVNAAVGATAGIQSIVFGPSSTLFGAQDSLFTINPTTGVTTLVGSGGYSDIRGIEFVGVPEPATMTLLGIGLVGLVGASARRRRKKKAVVNS